MNRTAALRIVLDHCRATGDDLVRAAAQGLEPKVNVKVPKYSDRGYLFADWFRSMLPAEVRVAAGWRDAWAQCFDLLLLDDRTPEQIAAVCRWARSHDFWRPHFQTPLKLRQRKDGMLYFDRFAEAMKSGGGGARKAQSRGYEIAPGKASQAVSALDLLQGK